MSVYMVIEIAVKDPDRYAQYLDRVRPVVEAHGGRYLARGGQVTPMSGGWNPERIVIIAFESLERLRQCFGSLEYRELAPLREASTESRAVVVEGCSSPDKGAAKSWGKWRADRPGLFTDDDARAAWNEGAGAFNEFVESGKDYFRHEFHGPALLDACAPVSGLDVLDLGCGQGHFCRQLARRGARVTGVDLSETLIGYAQAHEAEEPLGVEYHVMSASESTRHWQGVYDLVTGCMSIHDMADVPGALQSAFEALRPGGRMVFSIPHPCTDTPHREWQADEAGQTIALGIGRYFESGPMMSHWTMQRLVYHWHTPCWHYTLAEWSEMTAGAGFLLQRLYEPCPTEEQGTRYPALDNARLVPTVLIFVLVKPGKAVR
jgi:uncharacterized protein (DUF1330 family)/2-polyprenyl-3-methyl-5-hydroxy-6-metoxy-1,4-benzoquinol methylase